jgi:hypothetical protein
MEQRDCGEHDARLTALEKSETEQWTEIKEIRGKPNWLTTGIIAALSCLCTYFGTAWNDTRRYEVDMRVTLGEINNRLNSLDKNMAAHLGSAGVARP